MSPNKLRRSFLPAATLIALLPLAVTTSLHAAALTWNGASIPSNNNWSSVSDGIVTDPGNWTGSTIAPTAGDTLNFAGNTNTSTFNNLTADISFAGINFTNTGLPATSNVGVFTLAGARITLGGNIVTTANAGGTSSFAGPDTISLDMILNGYRTITTNQFNATTQHNLTISGLISETGGSQPLVKFGAGTLLLSNNANSFTGYLQTGGGGSVSVPSLAASGFTSAAGAGSEIWFGNGTTGGGTLIFTGSGVTMDRALKLVATTTGSGTITQNAANGGTGLKLTGAITNDATTGTKTLILNGTNTDANEITSLITNDVNGGILAFTKGGSGTWKISNDNNSFTGSFTASGNSNATNGIATITSLAVKNVPSAAGAGTAINFGNGTTGGGNLNYIGTGVTTDRDLNFTATTTGRAIINNNGANGGTGLRFTGTITNTATVNTDTKIFTLGGANTDANEVSSAIANGAGGNIIALTKADAGTWTISGTNLYTGVTTVSAGVLKTTKAAALPGYTTGAGVVISGGTLGVQIGGAGWTTGQVDTLLSNATLTSGALGVDTTNGNLTQWTTFNGAGNFGSVGLTKLGTNVLTLDQANDYTGGTIVNNGTLRIGVGGSITSQPLTVNANGTGKTAVLDTNGNNLTITTLTLGGTGGTPTSTSNVQTGAGTLTLGSTTLVYNATGNPLGSTISGNLDMNAGFPQFNVGDSTTAINDLTVSANLSNGLLIKTGAGTLVLSGANSYAAGTFLREGTTKLGANDSILTTSAVNFQNTNAATSATFDLAGFSQTLGQLNLTFSGGNVTTAGAQPFVIDSVGTGVLKLGGNVTYNLSANANPWGMATVSARLGLNGATRTFNIADNTGLPVDTLISGVIQNSTGTAGLTKTGDGTLSLTGANTYNGDTTVSAGTLATNGSSIPNTSTLTIDGTGAVSITGTEVVGQLVIGANPPITSGTYSSLDFPGVILSGQVQVGAAGGYAAWAATNAPTGTAKDDFDNDSVSNGTEYVLGGTKITMDAGKLPTISATGGNLTFSFKRAQASIDGTTVVKIEVGTNLSTWPVSYVVPDGAAANNPGVTVLKNNPSPGIDTVTLVIPQTPDTKKFARLNVKVN